MVKQTVRFCTVLALVLSFLSCMSMPRLLSGEGKAPAPLAVTAASAPTTQSAPSIATATVPSPAAAAAPEAATPAAQTVPSGALAEMDGFLSKAREAVDSNHLSEAIRDYVSVIAIYEGGPTTEGRAKAEQAAKELAKIGGRLSLEPSSEWMDPKGAQIAGATRSVGKEGALNPSVYLFESFGSGKSPVPDASIYFDFVKNGGSLVQLVTTDAYGKANTTVAKIEEPGKEAVLRAYPLFRARGKTYAFKSVFRDFAYLPPSNIARVVALETSELGASDNPQTVDAVIASLKPAGLQLSPFNGKLASEAFKLAFGGDTKALLSFGAEVPYTAFVLVEASDLRQMELNGKKYNIYTAATKATFRLVRSDGTVVYALPLDAVKGQGGTREAAVADGYKRARDALGPALQSALPGIRDALNKE